MDNGISKLQIEPEGVKTKSLKLLQGAGGQLLNLVAEDRESAEQARLTTAAIRAATDDQWKPRPYWPTLWHYIERNKHRAARINVS